MFDSVFFINDILILFISSGLIFSVFLHEFFLINANQRPLKMFYSVKYDQLIDEQVRGEEVTFSSVNVTMLPTACGFGMS